jgi:predicted restriction endonuclease
LSSEGRRKYCEQCYQLYRFPEGIRFEEATKGDLFRRRCNWQSARSSIRNHASRVFAQSGLPLVCHICGYFHHVQIAHRRPVSDFPDSAIMKEINDIANLIALCPNHHWELDHGILNL